MMRLRQPEPGQSKLRVVAMTASPSQLSRRAGNGPSRSFKLKMAAGELTFKTLYGKQALTQSTLLQQPPPVKKN